MSIMRYYGRLYCERGIIQVGLIACAVKKQRFALARLAQYLRESPPGLKGREFNSSQEHIPRL